MTIKWPLYAKYVVAQINWLEDLDKRTGGAIFEDRTSYTAALYSLFTLADAANKIPDPIKAEFPHIDWGQIKGFRNVLVHDYLGVEINQDIVRLVLTEKLPELKAVAETLVAREKDRIV